MSLYYGVEYIIESITLHGTPFILRTKSGDAVTWNMAYNKGYREARYPVPAHRYNVLFTHYSVEIAVGVTKQWYLSYPVKFQGPYYYCDCVLYVQPDFPEDHYT